MFHYEPRDGLQLSTSARSPSGEPQIWLYDSQSTPSPAPTPPAPPPSVSTFLSNIIFTIENHETRILAFRGLVDGGGMGLLLFEE